MQNTETGEIFPIDRVQFNDLAQEGYPTRHDDSTGMDIVDLPPDRFEVANQEAARPPHVSRVFVNTLAALAGLSTPGAPSAPVVPAARQRELRIAKQQRRAERKRGDATRRQRRARAKAGHR